MTSSDPTLTVHTLTEAVLAQKLGAENCTFGTSTEPSGRVNPASAIALGDDHNPQAQKLAIADAGFTRPDGVVVVVGEAWPSEVVGDRTGNLPVEHDHQV